MLDHQIYGLDCLVDAIFCYLVIFSVYNAMKDAIVVHLVPQLRVYNIIVVKILIKFIVWDRWFHVQIVPHNGFVKMEHVSLVVQFLNVDWRAFFLNFFDHFWDITGGYEVNKLTISHLLVCLNLFNVIKTVRLPLSVNNFYRFEFSQEHLLPFKNSYV